MQSLHYNSGSIKLTRERSTMVSRWEATEVARWIGGLAGLPHHISDIFLQYNIDGIALSLILRDDLIRMGITKLDHQLILMQSIDLLLTLVNRLSNETLALLFMRIHCAATTCYNLLRRPDDRESIHDNNNTVINSPEFYTSMSYLSDTIVVACHWLGRLPFIENTEYIEIRRKIIKVLVQIRFLLRNLRLVDQINMSKSKLILEISELRTTAISLVRQNKDSLFSSDCYLTRVHLRRPIKDDVNIEYTTMPDFTHVISSIETEAASLMGSGFSALNIGDEIIEINNQVVIGWDPVHFKDLLRKSPQSNEICLLVKKMPRHNDDEVYTKRLVDGPQNPRRSRARGALERRKQQTQENRTMLLEQEGEIDIESEDETVYQSKRSSQVKRDQHSSLPDLTETLSNSKTISNNDENSNQINVTPSSGSTNVFLSPKSPIQLQTKQNSIDRPQSAGASQSSPNITPKTPRKMGIESYFSSFFRPRQDTKSIIADMNEHTNKDHPQLVHIKRIGSTHRQSSNNSSISLHDDQISSSPPMNPLLLMDKSDSQISLNAMSSSRSSLSNIVKSPDTPDKYRTKQSDTGSVKSLASPTELKSDMNIMTQIVTNKPPLIHSNSRKNSSSMEQRHPKRTSSSKNISCKDLGKGDCEGFLYRYMPKATITFVQWRLYWCVLNGGTLYIFKSKEDINQEIELNLRGKNVSPAPERRKYAFGIGDENSQNWEYFCCTSRDDMAKWMNKMGLAAINFNIDDSKIAGFNRGFVDSKMDSPITTPIIGKHSRFNFKHRPSMQISSPGESEYDSDKESYLSWQRPASHHSSISDIEQTKNKKSSDYDQQSHVSATTYHTRSSSSTSLKSLPDAPNNPIKPTSNRFLGQLMKSTSKGHQRTSSSPIGFPIAYDINRENSYVHTAPRLSDSDSPNEHSPQRILVNTNLSVNNNYQSDKNPLPLMLNSSGGFSTTTISLQSHDKITPLSSSTTIVTSTQQPSSGSVFLPNDEDFYSRSSRSASCSFEDPLSPVFQNENFPFSKSTTQHLRLDSSSSSSLSSQQHPSVIVNTTPLYISIHSSTPPVPHVKQTILSSASPNREIDDHQLLFTGRSPSPPSVLKKSESPNNSTKQIITSSMQQSSAAFHRQQYALSKDQLKQ